MFTFKETVELRNEHHLSETTGMHLKYCVVNHKGSEIEAESLVSKY